MIISELARRRADDSDKLPRDLGVPMRSDALVARGDSLGANHWNIQDMKLFLSLQYAHVPSALFSAHKTNEVRRKNEIYQYYTVTYPIAE